MISPQNFSALTRLDQNRGIAQVASRLKVAPERVKNVIIWGNHSKTQYPDVNHGYVEDFPSAGQKTPSKLILVFGNKAKWETHSWVIFLISSQSCQ